MPTLYYRDPADGTFKPYAAGASNEVVVNPTQPTDANVELWMDPTTPGVGQGNGWDLLDQRYDTRYGTRVFYRNRGGFAPSNLPIGFDGEMWSPNMRIALGTVKAGDWVTFSISGYSNNTGAIGLYPVILNAAGAIQDYLIPRDTTFADWYLEAGTKQYSFTGTLPILNTRSPANLAMWMLVGGYATNFGVAGLAFHHSCIHHKNS